MGQNQNIVRWCHTTKDKAEFERKLLAYDLDIYTNFYGPFFPQLPTGDEATRIESIKSSGIFLGGSVDDCIREWQKTYSKAPGEFITRNEFAGCFRVSFLPLSYTIIN